MKVKAFLLIELSISITLCALTVLGVMSWYGYALQKYTKGSSELHALELGLWEVEEIHNSKPRISYQKKCEEYRLVCTVLPCIYTCYYPVHVAVYDSLFPDKALINLATGFCV